MNAPKSPAADAAVVRQFLTHLGLSPHDLVTAPEDTPVPPPVPTFAEFIPVVSDAVSAGSRRLYTRTGTKP